MASGLAAKPLQTMAMAAALVAVLAVIHAPTAATAAMLPCIKPLPADCNEPHQPEDLESWTRRGERCCTSASSVAGPVCRCMLLDKIKKQKLDGRIPGCAKVVQDMSGQCHQ
ncbi:hypothetical protein ACP70R_047200 [Stipagrostis hirtigluma subsp. patula]